MDVEKDSAPVRKEEDVKSQSREERVRNAIKTQDWGELEALSLLPGGFQDARIDAW
jgi:hypothetical protein